MGKQQFCQSFKKESGDCLFPDIDIKTVHAGIYLLKATDNGDINLTSAVALWTIIFGNMNQINHCL